MIIEEIAVMILEERSRLTKKYGKCDREITINLSLEAYRELFFVNDFYDLGLNLYDKSFMKYPFRFNEMQMERITLQVGY